MCQVYQTGVAGENGQSESGGDIRASVGGHPASPAGASDCIPVKVDDQDNVAGALSSLLEPTFTSECISVYSHSGMLISTCPICLSSFIQYIAVMGKSQIPISP